MTDLTDSFGQVRQQHLANLEALVREQLLRGDWGGLPASLAALLSAQVRQSALHLYVFAVMLHCGYSARCAATGPACPPAWPPCCPRRCGNLSAVPASDLHEPCAGPKP